MYSCNSNDVNMYNENYIREMFGKKVYAKYPTRNTQKEFMNKKPKHKIFKKR